MILKLVNVRVKYGSQTITKDELLQVINVVREKWINSNNYIIESDIPNDYDNSE